MSLPPVDALARLSAAEVSRVLSLLFEPSPSLETLLASDLASTRFPTYDALISHVDSRLTALVPDDASCPSATLDTILGSHPRLGAPKPDQLSNASRAEQSQLHGSNSPQARADAERLSRLNDEYEERFPGLRYVVFVNGRPRDVIMEDMQRRIHRADPGLERMEGVRAMCSIAADRAGKMPISADVDQWRAAQQGA